MQRTALIRAERLISLSSIALSATAIGAVIAFGKRSDPVPVVVLTVVLTWWMIPPAVDALFRQGTKHKPASDVEPGTVSAIILIDDEPPEIVRASVRAAASSVPTVVVAAAESTQTSALDVLAVPVFVDASVEQAISRAAATLTTDAVVILSASAFLDVEACQQSAGLIRQGAGWVTGHSEGFNRDGFAPMVREQLGSCLRTSARNAGLELWEPNATIVSTRLLRSGTLEPHRAWGTWLRSWADAGERGAEQQSTVSGTAEEVDARSFWPASVLRRRRAAADLADAVHTSRGRLRWLATGLLLRELNGFPMAFCLLLPWLVTRHDNFAFSCSPWLIVAVVVVPVLFQWFVQRARHGVRAHPLDDLLASAFDAPGSVLALPSAITGRVHPTRIRIRGQPLAVAALVFAAITVAPLFDSGTTASRTTAVGLAFTELSLLWLLAMRTIFQRNWSRTTYRIRTRLGVVLDGQPATTVDISPTGLGVEGDLHDIAAGSHIELEISLDDGRKVVAHATVADRETRGNVDVAHLALHLQPSETGVWVRQLSRSAAEAGSLRRTRPSQERTEPSRTTPTTILRSIVVAMICLATACAVVAVYLAAIGDRPLIVRSGSMEPALYPGDVIFVENVEARQLEVGDIATFTGVGGVKDSLSHRVRSVTTDGQTLTITTRGDANLGEETIRITATAIVGRATWRIARIGFAVMWAATATARWIAAIAGFFAIGVTGVRARLRRLRSGRAGRARIRAQGP